MYRPNLCAMRSMQDSIAECRKHQSCASTASGPQDFHGDAPSCTVPLVASSITATALPPLLVGRGALGSHCLNLLWWKHLALSQQLAPGSIYGIFPWEPAAAGNQREIHAKLSTERLNYHPLLPFVAKRPWRRRGSSSITEVFCAKEQRGVRKHPPRTPEHGVGHDTLL